MFELANTKNQMFDGITQAAGRGRAGRPECGFSLIEMVAVLAILAIMVAMAAPSVIRQVDQGSSTKEKSDLSTFNDALTRSVLRTKVIPSAANMASAIASEA